MILNNFMRSMEEERIVSKSCMHAFIQISVLPFKNPIHASKLVALIYSLNTVGHLGTERAEILSNQ